MGEAEQALRALIERLADTPSYIPAVAPGDVGSYVFHNGPDHVLALLDHDHRAQVMSFSGQGEPRLMTLLSHVYADPSRLQPEVLVRWGKVLAAMEFWAPHDLGDVRAPSVGRWPQWLLHQVGHAGLAELPPLRLLEPALRAGGTHAGEVVADAFFHQDGGQTGRDTLRRVLWAMPDYAHVVAQLADWLMPHLDSGTVADRLMRLRMLEPLPDPVLETFVEPLVELALATSSKVREAALPLVVRVIDAADPLLRECVASGPADRRARALDALWAGGGERRGEAVALARADKAATVRELVTEWEQREAWEEPGAIAAVEPLPAPDWPVTLAPEHDDTLRDLEERVRKLAARDRPGAPAIDVPDDYLPRLRALLADAAPATTGLPDLSSRQVPYLAVPLERLPILASLQVLAAHGLLGDDQDGAWLVHSLLARSHASTGAPTLLEAEAMLEPLGADAGPLLRHLCVHSFWSTGSGLAADWPADDVAPWAARHVDALVKQHETGASHYDYDRGGFFRLLGVLDPLPTHVVDWLFTVALGAKAVDRRAAQDTLDGHESVTERCIDALSHRSGTVRAVAAEWLQRRPDPAALDALEEAVRKEEHDVARSAMLDALVALGRPIADYVDWQALEQEAARELASGVPAAVGRLDLDSLPPVCWAASGDPVSDAMLRWLVVLAVKGKDVAPGALLQAAAASFDESGRGRLGEALLAAWMAADAPATAKGVLALVAVCGGPTTVAAAADLVRTHHGTRAAQSKALVAMLSHVDHPSALEQLVLLADKLASRPIRKVAAEQVAVAAARLGWSMDELVERTVPTLGLDASGRARLDYGSRSFEIVLRPDLTLGIHDESGRSVRSLPPARAADDPALVASAKQTLAAHRKTLKSVVALQTSRLREAMTVQREWRWHDLEHDVLGHPVLRRLAVRLVWVAEPAGGQVTFRPLDDGTLTDADDEPVVLDDETPVRLAHETLVPADQREQWLAHLDDYEVLPLFEQLADPLPALGPSTLAGTSLDDAAGVRLSAGTLNGVAQRRGFQRGEVGDGAAVHDYVRELPSVGLSARLDIPVSTYVGDWQGEVELGPLHVMRDGSPLPLSEVPPVLLSELRRDLAVIAAAGSRTRKEKA